MRVAHIIDGTVWEVADIAVPITQAFPPSMLWVEAPNDVQQGWLWDGERFREPEPDAELLEHAKARKNAEINAARLQANRTSFTHAGKSFACDELSRSDIDGTNGYVTLHSALPDGWPGGWKAIDNSYLPIPDVPAWTAFYTAMFAAGNANFAHAQALKAQLEAATTVEQVNAIRWE